MDTLPPSQWFDGMRFRQRAFETVLAAGRPPTDWQSFVRLALEVERDIHGGAAGVAYEPFYAPLFAYMKTANAPPEAVAAISFSYALASWDWPRAVSAGDTVARSHVKRVEWIPIDMLRDGLIVAYLRMGDPLGARRASTALARYTRRRPTHLRSLLLESWVESAETVVTTAALPTGR
jgi:hypothetical protein